MRLGRRALIGALAALTPLRARAQGRQPPRLGILVSGGSQAQLARHGAEIAAELANRRGRPMALRFAESRGDAETAQRAVTRLIDDGADLVISTCGEATTMAALHVAERRETPFIVACAGAPGLTDRGARMVVRTAPTMSQLIGRGLGLMRDLHAAASIPLPRRLALVHALSAEGALMRATLAAVLPAANLPLEAYAEIPIATEDGEPVEIPAILARLRAAEAEVVLVEAPPAAAAAVIGAVLADGVRPSGLVAFGIAGLASQAVLALPLAAGDNHVTFAPWPDARSPVTAEVRSLFARRNPPTRFELVQGELALTVDALLLASEALARQPAARGPALAAALRATVLTQKMMRGPPMRFDARGQNTTLPSVALQNQGGRPVVVLPREGADAQPVWPNPALVKT
jgi:branched-chain amino acid transport system substrate-binding protein